MVLYISNPYCSSKSPYFIAIKIVLIDQFLAIVSKLLILSRSTETFIKKINNNKLNILCLNWL